MKAKKILLLLGLAKRAGKVISGEEKVVCEIRERRAKLLILATDVAVNTEKKILNKASFYQIPCYRFGDRETLGKAIGKENRVVLIINDKGFAEKMKLLLDELPKNEEK